MSMDYGLKYAPAVMSLPRFNKHTKEFLGIEDSLNRLIKTFILSNSPKNLGEDGTITVLINITYNEPT